MSMGKKIAVWVGAVFFVFMAALTVWARISYQNSLPIVGMDVPRAGALSFQYTAFGTARSADRGFTVKVEFPAESVQGEFPFYRDDTVTLTFPNLSGAAADGVIERVDRTDAEISVTVFFSQAETLAGDSVQVDLSKQSRQLDSLLPAAALYQDNVGSFIWLVDEAQGAWGKEYVVEKKYVSVQMSDGTNFFLTSAVDKPVVVSTTRPLFDGQAVRFYP